MTTLGMILHSPLHRGNIPLTLARLIAYHGAASRRRRAPHRSGLDKRSGMGIWRTLLGTGVGLLLGGPLGALAGGAAGSAAVRGWKRAGWRCRRQVAFTIAAIALAAKMARADGEASATEFATFERLFRVPDGERANATRFYRMAQGSTAGFEAYASQAATLLGPGTPVLEDLLEALLLIAVTDGVHPGELEYLSVVADRFGFDPAAYARIRARHIAPAVDDPFVVLGIAPGASLAEVRSAYRGLVKTYHPDRHMAAGTPPEFLRVAEARMAAINAAYATVAKRLA
jgi:DnaJ like chaperone protein